MSISYNALSGALAAQAAINTVSQNVANLQTKGYTRQGVLLQSIGSDPGVNSPGNGVQVGALLRFSDSYKSQQMWRSNSDLGQRSQVQPYLTQLEKVMADKTSSISYGVDNFFKALNAAAVDPTSTPLRQQVITMADSMSQQINSIYNLTATQRVSLDQQRTTMLPSINESLAGIAALNKQIIQVGSAGTSTSGLIDQREQLIDGLSAQVAVEVLNNPDGSVSVSLKTGQPLVVTDMAAKLGFNTLSGTQNLELTFANTTFKLDDSKVGGQLGGLGDFLKNTLEPLQLSISEIAEQMSKMVNDQLKLGFTAPGVNGTDLFVFNPSSATGLLGIDPTITAAGLAFSNDGTPGNSSNLQVLIDIKSQPIVLTGLGSVLLNDADTQVVGKLAVESQQNQALLKTATTIRQQSEDDWKSTSAVNRDEEAINLIEFQNMYQANMKVISVANNLFDATLQMFN
jgi:flagellar hook-associated protein 1 FlgK